MINTAAYLAVVAFVTAMLTLKNKATAILIYTIGTIMMSACLTYSMLKLRKHSQLLTSLGITFSKKLLSIHLGSFWVASLVYIPDTFMTIAVGLQLQNNDYSHNSLAFT